MLKLMKYEARRQVFSKVVILGGLLIASVAFFVFYQRGMENSTMTVLNLMGLATIMIPWFAVMEYVDSFGKDLNTRQGYLVFMIPKKTTAILAAKLLVALIHVVVLGPLFFSVVSFCERLSEDKYGYNGGMILLLVHDVSAEVSGVGDAIGLGLLVLSVLLFVANVCAFGLATQAEGKMAFLVPVEIVAIAFVAFFLLGRIDALLDLLKTPELVGDIVKWVYMIGIDAALFFGSARLIDKKASI